LAKPLKKIPANFAINEKAENQSKLPVGNQVNQADALDRSIGQTCVCLFQFKEVPNFLIKP
jgi:hypothetical protein